jgi:hypothetical protein
VLRIHDDGWRFVSKERLDYYQFVV